MTFYKWSINRYKGQNNPRGDLASDMEIDTDFPKKGGYRAIRKHLEKMGACEGCLDAFEHAWKEFLANGRA